MLVDSAIELINSVVYKPNWTLEATDYTNRFEGTICVKVSYPAKNSDRDNARNNYQDGVEPVARASFAVMVSDLDDVGLYRKLIDIIMTIELHEAREFLRVHPTYWAPFHPHRIDGMRRWGNVHEDLIFGLV